MTLEAIPTQGERIRFLDGQGNQKGPHFIFRETPTEKTWLKVISDVDGVSDGSIKEWEAA